MLVPSAPTISEQCLECDSVPSFEARSFKRAPWPWLPLRFGECRFPARLPGSARERAAVPSWPPPRRAPWQGDGRMCR